MQATAYNKLLVKNVLEHPFDFKWSVQGLGMMRTYLSDAVRLHIWDRRLRIEGVSDLHTHPWHLHSTVIAGVYQQRRYTETAESGFHDAGEFNKVTIQCGEKACLMGTPEKVRLLDSSIERYTEGKSYFQDASEIHKSFPEAGTVTIVSRFFTKDREHADIYWPGDGPWVDAKPRSATRGEIEMVTRYSLERWF